MLAGMLTAVNLFYILFAEPFVQSWKHRVFVVVHVGLMVQSAMLSVCVLYSVPPPVDSDGQPLLSLPQVSSASYAMCFVLQAVVPKLKAHVCDTAQ